MPRYLEISECESCPVCGMSSIPAYCWKRVARWSDSGEITEEEARVCAKFDIQLRYWVTKADFEDRMQETIKEATNDAVKKAREDDGWL